MWNPFKRDKKAEESAEEPLLNNDFEEELFTEQIERYSKLQQIAATYVFFKFYIKEQDDWEIADNLEDDEGWIRLHPYPEVMPSHYYDIRYIGEKPLHVAVDEMMDDFLLNEDNSRYWN